MKREEIDSRNEVESLSESVENEQDLNVSSLKPLLHATVSDDSTCSRDKCDTNDLSSNTFQRNKRRMSQETNDSFIALQQKRNCRLSNSSPYPDHLAANFSSWDDEVDIRLAEELIEYSFNSPSVHSENEVEPIPLLTPPGSPIPIHSEESVTDIYEWPSNLAVDIAYTAASTLHPLSLREMEEIDKCDEPFIVVFPRLNGGLKPMIA